MDEALIQLLDNVHHIVWLVSATDAKLIFLNLAFERITGRERKSVLGQPAPFTQAIHPQDRERVVPLLNNPVEREIGKEVEYRIVRTDGSIRWLRSSAFAIRDNRGKVSLVAGVAEDITERKQAEATTFSLLHIGERLNSTLDVDELLDSLVIEAMKLTESEIGLSGLRTAEGMVCHKYFQGSQVIPFEYCWPPGAGWPGWTQVHKQPYVANDARTDNVLVPEIRERLGIRSGVETPILDRRGEVIGFLEVINKNDDSRFTPADVEKLLAVSQAASVRLQNALAYQRLKEARESLRQLSGRLLRLQDAERRRLARELHDSTAQALTGLKVNLAMVEESAAVLDPRPRRALAEATALADQCLREVRTITYLLHPPALDELGLQSALTWYVDGFVRRSGIRVDLNLPPDLGRLPGDLETTLFRIVQESLTNIHRHSGSRVARISILRSSDEIRLEVSDEGRGMVRGKARDRSAQLGVGIPGMRERVRQVGGRLDILSGDQGTTVRVSLPFC